jgi:propanol-preferring alcohol dehydrogenase
MKAMVLDKPGPVATQPLAARELDDPRPRAGEVVLRVLSCGVCRTDLHTVEGELPLPRLPLVPGHQIVGIVEEAAPELGPGMAGRRVGVAWLAGACGDCTWCRSGRENLCPGARFTGLHRDGGYAERVAVDAAFTYPIPATFDDLHAAPLLCAGVIGYRALRLSGALTGGTLGIFGFGASAHVAIQVARHFGCRVFVFTRTARHHDHARALGADWTGAPGETPPAPLDHAVIFSPAGEQVPLAISLLDRGGRVACAGVTMSDLPGFPYELLYQERVLRSVANATRTDAAELLALAEEIPITTTVEPVPLAQANEALLRVKESRVAGALVLVPD